MSSAARSRSEQVLAVALTVTVAVTSMYFYSGGGWNQNAHFALALSLVEAQKIEIDDYAPATGDVLHRDGHVYANKPPGLSLWIVPAILAARAVVDVWVPARDNVFLIATSAGYVSTAMSGAIAAGAIAAGVFIFLRRNMGASLRWTVFVALASALATPVLPYSTALFVHSPSAALLLWSFIAAHGERSRTCGFLAGSAALTNYLCLPVALLTMIYAAAKSRRRVVTAVSFVTGAAVPIAVLIAYQYAITGQFLGSPVPAGSEFSTPGSAFGVLLRPSFPVLFEVIFGLYRGLLPLAPVVVMALLGTTTMLRDDRQRAIAIYTGSTFLFFLLFHMTFNGWHGGAAVGPRYLIPAIPLLMLGLGRISHPLARSLTAILGAASAASMLIVTAVSPFPPQQVRRPLTEFYLPALLRGDVDDRGGEYFRPAFIPGHHVSVNPSSVDGIWSEWSSFNLGELIFGAGNPWSLLPILLFLVIAIPLLLRMASRIDAQEQRQRES